MKRPSFFQGVVLALIAALLGEVLFVALAPLTGSVSALHMVIASASFAYILYLLRASDERLGRVVALSGWLLITVVTAWMGPPLVLYLLIHVGMIWLVRALYFYSSLMPALADLGLNALAMAAVVWATVQSGSLMLALWCFFLVQALFVLLPWEPGRAHGSTTTTDPDKFEQARRSAQTALRKLSTVN